MMLDITGSVMKAPVFVNKNMDIRPSSDDVNLTDVEYAFVLECHCNSS